MQESPEFSNLQQRFASLPLETVDGQPPQKFAQDGAESTQLARTYELLNLYFNNASFREDLTLRFRTVTLDQQILGILNTFDQVVQGRNNGTLQANRQGFIDSFQDQSAELERQLTPYLVRGDFVKQLDDAAAQITSILANAKTQGQEASTTISDTLTKVRLRAAKVFDLADLTTRTVLGDYFHRCYNGRSIAEQEKWNKDHSKKNSNWLGKTGEEIKKLKQRSKALFWTFFALAGFFIAFIVWRTTVFFSRPELLTWNQANFHDARLLSLLIAGVIVLCALGYLYFRDKYPGGYERAAAVWFITLVVAIAAISVFVVHRASQLVSVLDRPGQANNPLELVLANAIILAVPAYAIRVCIVNYNANKHQAVLNLHRANILRTFPIIIQSIEGNDVEQARNVVLTALVENVFKPGATGHINRGQASDESPTIGFRDLLR